VSTIDFTAAASAQDEFRASGEITDQVLRDLDKGFGAILEKAPQLAESFIASAQAAGVPVDKLREWRSELQSKIGDDAAATVAQDEYTESVMEAAGAATEAQAVGPQSHNARF